jgi:hypothetical protein
MFALISVRVTLTRAQSSLITMPLDLIVPTLSVIAL